MQNLKVWNHDSRRMLDSDAFAIYDGQIMLTEHDEEFECTTLSESTSRLSLIRGTGIRDEKDSEIFDKHILLISDPLHVPKEEQKTQIADVFFEGGAFQVKGSFWFDEEYNQMYLDALAQHGYKFEIIGTQFENPELLQP